MKTFSLSIAVLLALTKVKAEHYGVDHDLGQGEESPVDVEDQNIVVDESDSMPIVPPKPKTDFPTFSQGELDEEEEIILEELIQEEYSDLYEDPEMTPEEEENRMSEVSEYMMHMQIMMDSYAAAFQIVEKYNLSQALQESSEIVSRESWLDKIQSENNTIANKAIGKAISPITEHVFQIPGKEMVKTLPKKLKSWIADSAILFAEMNGKIDDKEEPQPEEPQPEEPEIVICVFPPMEDQNELCPEWAAWSPSECEVNPDYMLVNCQASCDAYQNQKNVSLNTSAPVDYNENCADWASWSPSECEVNPGYMLKSCQKSCESYLNQTSDSLVDQNQQCPDWASWSPSECEVNPDYMLVNCKKSCESYLNGDQINTTTQGGSSITDIRFQEDDYIESNNENDWHFVWLTNPSCDGINYKWNNKAGVSWSLTAVWSGTLIDYFQVGEDCPYYNNGHTVAKIFRDRSASGNIIKLLGPWDEPFTAHEKFDIEFSFDADTCNGQEILSNLRVDVVGSTYATCEGTYEKNPTETFNGKPIWNRIDDTSRFAFFNQGGYWCITGSQWKAEFVEAESGNKGAFICSTNSPEDFEDTVWMDAEIDMKDDQNQAELPKMKKCAKENELCDCETEIYYGEKKEGKLNGNANFTVMAADKSGQTTCSNVRFGEDPLPGIQKSCFCVKKSSFNKSEEAELPKMNKCAKENELCDCETDIYYGEKKDGKLNKNANFTVMAADRNGQTTCSNTRFGEDPLPGTQKTCFCAKDSSDQVVDNAYQYRTLAEGANFGSLTVRNETDKAFCRCHTLDLSEGISICNSGCGDPYQTCTADFGCSFDEKSCNSAKCTCKPQGIRSNKMTYEQCHDQCDRIGMMVLNGEQTGVDATKNTGCDINSKEVWTTRTNKSEKEELPKMTKCAKENELCDCETEIYFGKKKHGKLNGNANYTVMAADKSGQTTCSNVRFGEDPLPGIQKTCFCAKDSSVSQDKKVVCDKGKNDEKIDNEIKDTMNKNKKSDITEIVFQEDDYIESNNENDWHFVWITNPSCDGINYMWNNKAGASWSLTFVRSGAKIDYFQVGEDCPYYDDGHTYATVSYNNKNQISGIYGPWGELYTAHKEFDIEFGYETDTCKGDSDEVLYEVYLVPEDDFSDGSFSKVDDYFAYTMTTDEDYVQFEYFDSDGAFCLATNNFDDEGQYVDTTIHNSEDNLCSYVEYWNKTEATFNDDGSFKSMMGPHGELVYLSSEEFEKLVSTGKEKVVVPYDEDSRDEISPYYIDKTYNFIYGANYDKVTLCEVGEQLSYTDAMNKAVELANERNAYGFFYQEHQSGYQIVGFYSNPEDMEGEKVSDGHKRGCIASLDDIRTEESDPKHHYFETKQVENVIARKAAYIEGN